MLLPLTEPLVGSVAARMRAADRAEVFATRRSEGPAELAAMAVRWSRFGAVFAGSDGVPASAIGAAELWPGLWSVWMFATDAWPAVRLATTRYARDLLTRQLFDAGAHRAECRSLATHREAHRWLALVGARREWPIPGYGKGREDFVTFSWRRDHVRLRLAGSAEAGTGADNR